MIRAAASWTTVGAMALTLATCACSGAEVERQARFDKAELHCKLATNYWHAGNIELAIRELVEALAAEFQPEKYKDAYRENLLQLIEAKKEGKEVVATPEPKQEKVVDILEALKASLAVAKKPAAIAQSITPIAEKAEPKRKRARG